MPEHAAAAPVAPCGSAARLRRARRRTGLDLVPSGEPNRVPRRITARYPGHLIHVDVKKAGYPMLVAGHPHWWLAVHGRGSNQHRATDRATRPVPAHTGHGGVRKTTNVVVELSAELPSVARPFGQRKTRRSSSVRRANEEYESEEGRPLCRLRRRYDRDPKLVMARRA